MHFGLTVWAVAEKWAIPVLPGYKSGWGKWKSSACGAIEQDQGNPNYFSYVCVDALRAFLKNSHFDIPGVKCCLQQW